MPVLILRGRRLRAQETFYSQLDRLRIEYRKNARWHPERRWEADVELIGRKVLIDIDGGIYAKGGKACRFCGRRQGGAHGTGKAIERDIQKSNEAQRLGYKYIRIPAHWVVKDGRVLTAGIEYVEGFLK